MSRPNTRLEGKRLADREDYDGTPAVYELVGIAWADPQALTGRELMHARQVNDFVTHKTRMPFQSWILSGVTWTSSDGKTYETISAVDKTGKGRWLDVMLVERV